MSTCGLNPPSGLCSVGVSEALLSGPDQLPLQRAEYHVLGRRGPQSACAPEMPEYSRKGSAGSRGEGKGGADRGGEGGDGQGE